MKGAAGNADPLWHVRILKVIERQRHLDALLMFGLSKLSPPHFPTVLCLCTSLLLQVLPLEPVLLPLTVAPLLCIYFFPVAEDNALPLTWFLARRASIPARELQRIWVRPLASVRQPSAA